MQQSRVEFLFMSTRYLCPLVAIHWLIQLTSPALGVCILRLYSRAYSPRPVCVIEPDTGRRYLQISFNDQNTIAVLE